MMVRRSAIKRVASFILGFVVGMLCFTSLLKIAYGEKVITIGGPGDTGVSTMTAAIAVPSPSPSKEK